MEWGLRLHTRQCTSVWLQLSFHWLQGQRVECRGQGVHVFQYVALYWGTCKGGLIGIGSCKPMLEYPSTSVDPHVVTWTDILIPRLSQKAGWGLGISLFLVPRPHPLTIWWTKFSFLGWCAFLWLVEPSNVQNIMHHTHVLRKCSNIWVWDVKFYCFRGTIL